jgi:EpsI family protein
MASIEALTVAAFLFADLRCPSWRQMLVIIAAAPLIAFVVNGFRVLWLVGDPTFDPQSDHTLQGIVMLLAGAFVLTRVDWLLARSERTAAEGGSPPSPERPSGADPVSPAPRWIASGALLAALAAASPWIPRWSPPEASPPPVYTLVPAVLGRWHGTVAAIDQQFLGTVEFSDKTHRVYRRARGEPVTLFVGVDHRLDRRKSFVSTKVTHPGFGWRVEERATVVLEPRGSAAESLLLHSPHGLHLVYFWYQGVASAPVEVLRALLALDRSALRRPGEGLVVRLSTPVASEPAGRAAAERRLRAFAKRLLAAPLFTVGEGLGSETRSPHADRVSGSHSP